MTEASLPLSMQSSELQESERSIKKTYWRRSVLKILFVTGICLDILLACALGYLIVIRSSYFNLNKVDVYGNHRLSKEEVIEAARLETGMNLLSIDLESITERLLRHPWIRSGSIYRRLPGQLVLEVEERTPRGILASDRLYYIDEKGIVFTRVLPGDPIDLPLFTGIQSDNMRLHPGEIQDSLRSGLKLTELIDRVDFGLHYADVREINISSEEGLTLKMKSGQIVILGHDDFESRLLRFDRLRKFLTDRGQWRNAHIINLDFEDRAIVRSSEDPLLQG
ncbi:MAG: cell division protein FtsQ [Thermodesulfobacteriota bacterium]|nr:cell division protein FtsQ [Thermodesulfobacteriota bacterium]